MQIILRFISQHFLSFYWQKKHRIFHKDLTYFLNALMVLLFICHWFYTYCANSLLLHEKHKLWNSDLFWQKYVFVWYWLTTAMNFTVLYPLYPSHLSYLFSEKMNSFQWPRWRAWQLSNDPIYESIKKSYRWQSFSLHNLCNNWINSVMKVVVEHKRSVPKVFTFLRRRRKRKERIFRLSASWPKVITEMNQKLPWSSLSFGGGGGMLVRRPAMDVISSVTPVPWTGLVWLGERLCWCWCYLPFLLLLLPLISFERPKGDTEVAEENFFNLVCWDNFERKLKRGKMVNR